MLTLLDVSGCSTLLKTISGETNGFNVDKETQINYQGISMDTMHKDFRGECIYQAEVDVHFPQLTVGQTLEFAARARGKLSSLLCGKFNAELYSSPQKPNSWRHPGAIREAHERCYNGRVWAHPYPKHEGWQRFLPGC